MLGGRAWKTSGGFLAIARISQHGPFDVGPEFFTSHTRCLLDGGAILGRRHLVWVWAVQPCPDMGLLDSAPNRPGEGSLPACDLHGAMEVFDAHEHRI